MEELEAELLPVPYFHVVFTLPAPIGDIADTNKAVIDDLLFKAFTETMLTTPRRGNSANKAASSSGVDLVAFIFQRLQHDLTRLVVKNARMIGAMPLLSQERSGPMSSRKQRRCTRAGLGIAALKDWQRRGK